MTVRPSPLIGKLLLLLLPVLLIAPHADCKEKRLDPDAQAFQAEMHKAMLGDSWPRCIDICNAYLIKHKNDVLARSLRGFSLMESNHDVQSIPDLSAAIAGGMTDVPADLIEDHTNSLLSMRGFAQMRVGRLREGIADIEKSLKRPQRMVSAYFQDQLDYRNLATAYQKLGDVSKAAQCREKSDQCERNVARVLQPSIKNADSARACAAKFAKECAGSANNSIPFTALTVYLIYLKNWSDALKSVDKAIALEPYMSRTHLMRIEILKNLHREADARAEGKLILKFVKRPSDSAITAGDKMLICSRLIEIYKHFNDLDGQIDVLETAAESGSAGESMYYDLGQCYEKKRQWAKAVETYGDALEYAVDNQPLVLDARARARRNLGQGKQAEQDEAEAKRLRQKSRKI